ncbi:hypothetical protein O6H91_09G030000 [Diphasiastrum complanatum]|uniref:Uncharacterized protein n=7 Tax=Diphasiastrum complanatum TaxID=34168 RepID=A0ACC2CMI2_DIPCM|nr:hypothetical protein O6H91_09G030000 [Diphasiastrum complanatum]KAJ7543224.1 hypothetical protein O6H91_09G030000 [Diphasiastrum complanatum]KAJ7543225.1 hypothetical protein O6H91_09G030000 [Diphasiastrum complanatum]KAJ7543227.1 hypothetical protein O6H91_09G030000 [Diphasiastrum complanatum]KAJ7543228.1 hypothetical protein O6H91_09G030000 [Diphasiastrum complanatum]
MAMATTSLLAPMAIVLDPLPPHSSSTVAAGSLLATHRLAPAGALLLFQSSNPLPFRCLHHRRSARRLLNSFPLHHHLVLCSIVHVQEEDSQHSQSKHIEKVEANPSFTSNNDAGRSKRSGSTEKDGEASQKSSISKLHSPDDAQALSDSSSKREFPWESGKPSDLGFDLPYSFSQESAGKEISARRFRSSSKEEENPVAVKNSHQLPSFDARSRLKAPWGQNASPGSAHREVPRKIPLGSGRQFILEESKEQVESDREDDSSYDEKWDKSPMARLVDKLHTIDSDIASTSRKASPRSALKNGFSDNAGPSLSSKVSMLHHPYNSSSRLDSEDVAKLKFPWDKEEEHDKDESDEITKRMRAPYQAEIVLSDSELKRLRNLSLRATFRLKIGKEGVTHSVVESIHQQWRQAEIVRVKCEGPPAVNMKKTHEELEEKTGGLVIWRSGSALTIYRGQDYVSRSVSLSTKHEKEEEAEIILGSETVDINDEDGDTDLDCINNNQDSSEDKAKEEYIKELEAILDGLGPRFEGWTRARPVPIDADLLPAFDPNFKTPLRLLPYGVRPNLSNTELTALRRLARPLPPHFVLGRNKNLEGLAGAIVKLWQKSEVVKISVKRGIQNTRNERMAEELKRLTGGVLLSRDKYFITIYRGKDFLPPAVAVVLTEREALANALQEDEERNRMVSVKLRADVCAQSNSAGTLAEALEVKSKWESWRSNEEQQKERELALEAARLHEVRSMERKLKIAMLKKERAERQLAKVEKNLAPVDAPADCEAITDEEKFMFRKLGLKMKAFLLIGRRGVFDGVVENMHLHWKHRELVKIILKEREIAAAIETARMLEYESGGILIAVVTVSKGQAIIVYRGKNYERPPQLRPRNLLSKRKALQRSIELQRRKSLEDHVADLERDVRRLKYKYDSFQEGSINLAQDTTSRFQVQGGLHECNINESDATFWSSGEFSDEDDVGEEDSNFYDSDKLDDDEDDVNAVNLDREKSFSNLQRK